MRHNPFAMLAMALSMAAIADPLAAQVTAAPLEIVDSAGASIGFVIDVLTAKSAVVSALIDGHPAVFNVSSDGVLGRLLSGTNSVFFVSTDCTGQAYTYRDQSSSFAGFDVQALAGSATNPSFYYSNATTQTITVNSSLGFGSSSCLPGTLTDKLIPVSKIRNLPFVPPFKMQSAKIQSATSTSVSSVPAVSHTGLVLLALLVFGVGAVLLRYRSDA